MRAMLEVENKVNIGRYFNPDALTNPNDREDVNVRGLTGGITNSVYGITFGVVGTGGNTSFLGDMYEHQKIFREVIGDKWNFKTLIKKGTPVTVAPPQPYEYVDFEPVIENIAKVVYYELAPMIDIRMENVQLSYVKIVTALGAATFYNPSVEIC